MIFRIFSKYSIRHIEMDSNVINLSSKSCFTAYIINSKVLEIKNNAITAMPIMVSFEVICFMSTLRTGL